MFNYVVDMASPETLSDDCISSLVIENLETIRQSPLVRTTIIIYVIFIENLFTNCAEGGLDQQEFMELLL